MRREKSSDSNRQQKMLPNAKNTASTTASHHQLYFNLTAPLSESIYFQDTSLQTGFSFQFLPWL
jgi:hypothetical protein